jgi:hypothetical protein
MSNTQTNAPSPQSGHLANRITPGEWRIVGDGETWELIVRSEEREGQYVAGEVCRIQCHTPDPEHWKNIRAIANANLIVAAPKMLRLIERLVAWDNAQKPNDTDGLFRIARDAHAIYRDAIANRAECARRLAPSNAGRDLSTQDQRA